MSDFLTPTFLKLLRRFTLTLLVGIIGALIAGQLHTRQEEAHTYSVEINKQ